ncbi:MAG: 1-acyl-sn-glycerol-3-phosphate acyltransferase [Ignavibacteriaceae bacterium]|jgi:1-acyl-sn-glycerol-3-phosphate acyltransferase|nr:1-acyl-sn-glycerol-3-phosphate acyltransferase [Ignavibacteriaceae bacterium]MCW8813653.1 1-acyl-sn-glycerol-3-phosphate acyltransferase [Chlorobium sp.]MCW8817820.1 1-acyl-sn-glycerol-3-phosphate acyltransferase [Ignavibacteriaceae bacterium]MCW8823603.1 1-acyl-sn-glycerol-3-phosphate acyltransferase [Ignavibacteriaceae bacterium]MCW9096374.1 1-acyl-sn-glycerol-3-phosphate acyltransferase [Ignavibacteriaceae bacterium]
MITALKLFLIVIHTFICSIFAMIFAVIDRSYTVYFKISKIFSGGVLLISGIKLDITGLENIDKSKTYVFVSNHSSQYDIVVLQKTIPNRMAMIFKKELAKIPFFGWQLAMGPYVMIDRGNYEKAMRSIEEAKEKMKKKSISIVVFAEGTRSKTGDIQPFKRGAFRLATQVGYPIIPTTVIGSNKIMPKGTYKLRRGTIKVHFDKPIQSEGIKTRQEEIDLMNRVRDIIVNNNLI